MSQTPITTAGVEIAGGGGFTWWVDAPAGLLRGACDQSGDFPFTPLFALKRPIKRNRRFFRDRIMPDPTGDELSVLFALVLLFFFD